MEPSVYLDVVRVNAEQFVAAVRRAGTGAPVPTCPDWTVADLARHQGRVFRWISGMVEAGAQEMAGREELEAQARAAEPIEWLETGAAEALAILERSDPDAEVWNWIAQGPGPAALWWRRMAHETVIHRVDAEAAAGLESRVEPPELASDGIDEFLSFVPLRNRQVADKLGGSFHFHSTDVAGEWVVVFSADGVAVTREHAKADVAIRGAASDLELFIYNRRGSDGLETFGDPARVAAWTDLIRF